MRLKIVFMPLLVLGASLLCNCNVEARKIRVRPQEQEEETVEYYAAEPQDSRDDRVVYISSADQYNGLYGQQSGPSRASQDNAYLPRSSVLESKSRQREPSKAPPVQTIRNYNKVNDDGSFTFGYEAADGSFKEETRGTDCVVRGKYGYVDPDGNKREFTYVSGNPCDPNSPREEDLDDKPEEESNEPENIPANYPTKPIRPLRPIATSPPKPITLFQNNYAQEEEEPEPEQILRPQSIQPARRPVYIPRPQYIPEPITDSPIYDRSRYYAPLPSSTPASVIYKNSITPLNITPRPASRPELPITTYKPFQLATTPRPALLYTKQIASPPRPILPATTPSPYLPSRANIDFDAEFQKFQQENNVIASTPSPIAKTVTVKTAKDVATTSAPPVSGAQIYSSELVYDPASGQYNNQLYQTLPQTDGEFTLNHKIQPYVHQPTPQVINVQQLLQQSPLYKPRPQTNQALYQQQQSELQFQNSAQLYAQQQKARQQQVPQPSAPPQFYYIQPTIPQPSSSYTTGQIDAFLRGHNIQF